MGGRRRPGRTCDDQVPFPLHFTDGIRVSSYPYLIRARFRMTKSYIHDIYFPGDLRRDDGDYPSSPHDNVLRDWFCSRTFCRKWARVVNTTRQRSLAFENEGPLEVGSADRSLVYSFGVRGTAAALLRPSPTSFAPETLG
jgi:hypothetical protein